MFGGRRPTMFGGRRCGLAVGWRWVGGRPAIGWRSVSGRLVVGGRSAVGSAVGRRLVNLVIGLRSVNHVWRPPAAGRLWMIHSICEPLIWMRDQYAKIKDQHAQYHYVDS